MSKEIVTTQEFTHSRFGNLRIVVVDGEVWFVAVDVCRALALSDTSMAVSRLKDSEKGTSIIRTLRGGPQKMLIVNEPGLYRLIFQSRKPEAEEFQDWVFYEVLPSIRKTGSYSINGESAPDITLAQEFTKLATMAKNSVLRDRLIRQAATILSGEDFITPEEDLKKNFIEKFIDKFCVIDKRAAIKRGDFLDRLRVEYPDETAMLTDRSLTAAVRDTPYIEYKVTQGCARKFSGIRWNGK